MFYLLLLFCRNIKNLKKGNIRDVLKMRELCSHKEHAHEGWCILQCRAIQFATKQHGITSQKAVIFTVTSTFTFSS
jgi:hypothetical protein